MRKIGLRQRAKKLNHKNEAPLSGAGPRVGATKPASNSGRKGEVVSGFPGNYWGRKASFGRGGGWKDPKKS